MSAVADKPNKNRRPTPASVQGASGSPTSASTWKKKTVGGTLITVPSGNTALVRTPGMQVFVEQGVIPNALMPIIKEAMSKGMAPAESEMSEMVTDPDKLRDLIELANAITVFCCIDPKVEAIPTQVVDGEVVVIPMGDPRRSEEILYIDEVEFNDKMYIFNFAVGGPADMDKFRS